MRPTAVATAVQQRWRRDSDCREHLCRLFFGCTLSKWRLCWALHTCQIRRIIVSVPPYICIQNHNQQRKCFLLECAALHEKIFVVFMTCSLLHMVTTIYLTNHLYPVTKSSSAGSTNSQNGEHIVGNSIDVTDAEHLHLIHYALRWKRRLFWLSIASTIGMIVHFARHRWYCHDLAFSWFALCEYVIACSNLAFHCTTIWDFPGEQLIVARGTGKLQRPPLHEHQPQQQQKKCT